MEALFKPRFMPNLESSCYSGRMRLAAPSNAFHKHVESNKIIIEPNKCTLR